MTLAGASRADVDCFMNSRPARTRTIDQYCDFGVERSKEKFGHGISELFCYFLFYFFARVFITRGASVQTGKLEKEMVLDRFSSQPFFFIENPVTPLAGRLQGERE